jgi:hypothetical protein
MYLIICWILFSAVVGRFANTRGRDGVGWFLLSLLISPLLAGLFLLASKNLKDPFADVATLAMIEATPEGSRSRQLLAEHDAKHEAMLASRPLHKRYVGAGYCPVCRSKNCTGTL